MKKINSLIALCIFSFSAFAQKDTLPSTDIFLMNMSLKDGKYVFGKPLNITDRVGYDNQPSFLSTGKKILYSSMRDGLHLLIQGDIKACSGSDIQSKEVQ